MKIVELEVILDTLQLEFRLTNVSHVIRSLKRT